MREPAKLPAPLAALAVAFSMYSALPVPQVAWTPRSMRYALAVFPLVGAVIGLVCWGLAALCGALGLPPIVRGAALTVAPVLLTGGIHLDGFADTCDARASHAEPTERQRILKDPHLGAFAAIRLGCYFVATLALWTALPSYPPLVVVLMFTLERALSALALTVFPLAKDTGLAHTFVSAAHKERLRVAMAVASAVLAVSLVIASGWAGVTVVAAAAAAFAYYGRVALREFGGLSGDLAGWFVQVVEVWMLFALCAVQWLEAAL